MSMRIFEETKSFDVNGNHYVFVNQYYEPYDGFNHKSKLFVNDKFLVEHTVHYLNRTWESYEFQTSMLGAVRKMLEYNDNCIKLSIKNTLGLRRWCKQCDDYKDEFFKTHKYMLDKKNDYSELEKILKCC